VFCTDLSLNDFPLPNVTEFINMAAPTLRQVPLSGDAGGGELPRNQWYYQYETSTHRRHGHRHRPDTAGDTLDRHGLKFAAVGGSDVTVTWVSFLAVLVAIDVVWFVHRMARTYSTAKMILYGWTALGEGIERRPNIVFIYTTHDFSAASIHYVQAVTKSVFVLMN